MKHSILLLVSAFLFGACELPEAISNGDIDSWCGDAPCDWETDGEVRRVGTWHSHDYAASLESDGARLHQLNDDINYPCLSFTMIAKVGGGAKAFLELDFLDDDNDHPEWHEQIPESNFDLLEFEVAAPEWYSSVRFIVRREGERGEVKIAQLRAVGSDVCTGEHFQLENLPGGAPCDRHDDCATEMCRGGYCVGCQSDGDCDDGSVCGYAPIGWLLPELAVDVLPTCIEPHQRIVGALCLGDSECASDVCCEGVCSTCCGETGCDAGRTCERSIVGDGEGTEILEPHLCSAGRHAGVFGDPCTNDDDCESESYCERLECTGLCSLIDDVSQQCAMLACDEPECSSRECAVETVDVGRCH